jgi:glycosyltransferase involved in cell wall biosynthesis
MPPSSSLVSIGIPLRNGEKDIDEVLTSVTAQTYENLEIIVSDNASDDGTEQLAKEWVRKDPRVHYHRQPENLGLHGNFRFVLGAATGQYFRWVGADDRLEPTYVERCANLMANDPALLLVTTQQSFAERDGTVRTARYDGTGLSSGDKVERFAEMLRLLNSSHLLIDPHYGLMRREPATAVPLKAMLRGDQIFVARLALAGPWVHVNEILAHRGWPDETRAVLARRLGVPQWNARVATATQARELLAAVSEVDLTMAERRTAWRAVALWYVGWHYRRVLDGVRRRLS